MSRTTPGIFVSRHSESRSLSVDCYSPPCLPSTHLEMNPFFLLLLFFFFFFFFCVGPHRRAQQDPPQTPGTRLVGDQPAAGRRASGDAGSQQTHPEERRVRFGFTNFGSTPSRSSSLTHSLTTVSCRYAQANFGSTADNATAVVAFLWRS